MIKDVLLNVYLIKANKTNKNVFTKTNIRIYLLNYLSLRDGQLIIIDNY